MNLSEWESLPLNPLETPETFRSKLRKLSARNSGDFLLPETIIKIFKPNIFAIQIFSTQRIFIRIGRICDETEKKVPDPEIFNSQSTKFLNFLSNSFGY